MLRCIDLNYYCHEALTTPEAVMQVQRLSNAYAYRLGERVAMTMVKHANYTGSLEEADCTTYFFKRRNRFWQIPLATHRFVQRLQPDIILVQGLVFPLQLLALRIKMGRSCRIVVQHHGERPAKGWRKWIQTWACRHADVFVCTAKDNLLPWIAAGIIPNHKPCVEILEAAVAVTPIEPTVARAHTRVAGDPVCLWVGRLHPDKDPLTVVQGFAKWQEARPDARLYMIFQEDQLLPAIQNYLDAQPALRNAIRLAGKVDPDDMGYWYSAADYFLSGSHREGSGYALLEAIQCGCIPVVTNIPAFKKITGNGALGVCWQAGDATDLTGALREADRLDRAYYREKLQAISREKFSAAAIANDWWQLCLLLQQQS